MSGSLFDVSRLTETRCSICGAIRPAGEERAPGCEIDRDRDAGDYRRRPADCLNTIDPATAPIPY